MNIEPQKYIEVASSYEVCGDYGIERLFRVDLKGMGFEFGVVKKVDDSKWTIEVKREE